MTDRPESFIIYDAYDDSIVVSTDDDGMNVVVSIAEHDGIKPIVTEVSLGPNATVKLIHALREAQLYIEESY